LVHQEGGFLSFSMFQFHQHGGHTLHGYFLSPLSPSARD
jgi:hypothetical protein